MAFSTFSRDFTSAMFTSVENQFITKYLPQADGDAVRVYLYGLYLCQCADDFDAASCAKLLRLSEEKLLEIFEFWEECDLVQILSRKPLYVQYLPVNAAIGKPKPIRAEKYAEFNREFYKLLQKAQKMFRPYEMQRILEFLENNPMEQQAFLLVTEYCIKKDGEKLSSAHILNKAKKLCSEHKFTYEQVEQEFAGFNAHEKELQQIFSLLGIYRKPREEDYAYLEKWTAAGVELRAVSACAASLKKGSLATLDQLIDELIAHDAHTVSEAKAYLARREEAVRLVYAAAKRLGVKVENPRAYAEEYAEKWLDRGYDEESVTLVSALAFKLRFGFPETDALLDTLYAQGTVDAESVRLYCAAQEKRLRLLQKIQAECGTLKKTRAALDMIETWRTWNFSDKMILEAARRSAGASAPLAYMNKLLSEWKRADVFSPENIPASAPRASAPVQAQTAAADERSAREHYYSVLRDRAVRRAETAQRAANADEAFRSADAAVRRGEIALAKAEVFSPEEAAKLKAALARDRERRSAALSALGLTEEDLMPQYSCRKCSDTGFLPDGRSCDCYRGN